MFELENVANTLIEMQKLMNCNSLKETWDNYIHDLIKSEFTFEEVENYIKD